jgi:hypothetical protein
VYFAVPDPPSPEALLPLQRRLSAAR